MWDNNETANAVAAGLKRKEREEILVKLLGFLFAFLFWIVVFLLLTWPLIRYSYSA